MNFLFRSAREALDDLVRNYTENFGAKGPGHVLKEVAQWVREQGFLVVAWPENDAETRRRASKTLTRILREEGNVFFAAEAVRPVGPGQVLWLPRQIPTEQTDDAFGELATQVYDEGQTLLDANRLYTIWQALMNVRHLPHPTMEIGVYRGGTSVFIARARQHIMGEVLPHFAIDPMTGHRDSDISDEDEHHKAGYFSDISVDDVVSYLGSAPGVTVRQGTFGDFMEDFRGQTFSFVHLDTDLRQPTVEALEFFAEHLAVGGVIIVDDYLAQKCAGVTVAVHEFVSRNDQFQVWSNMSEQAVLTRIR